MDFGKRTLSTREIREIFLEFFERKNHQRIGSASLLPRNDPTLLYINSGMAPLKPYFTGEEKPPRPDLCNVQPCIRTRDIDDVGDRHHLTFFEMLGSWSINHYWKSTAIELAFELLVKEFGFPADRLYATVYGGDPALNLAADEESIAAWEQVGLPRDHIVILGEDNFWGPAGDTGPCGPCTEVFFDTGEQFGPPYAPGSPFDTSRRYIEIWNAGVFMEYDRRADGTFAKLPFRSVDTGSGLERMAMVLAGAESVYDTDALLPLMAHIAGQLGTADKTTDRRIADHMRAATFILAEGVVPSNEGRGYIPRRLIRKCIALTVRAGKQSFDYDGLTDLVIAHSGDFYPHLREQRQLVLDSVARERAEFERVIERGLMRLDSLCKDAPFVVAGRDAFALFATFGMPLDLIRDFVHERGGTVEEESYLAEFRTHQDVSRGTRKSASQASVADLGALYRSIADQSGPVDFVGYDTLSATGRLRAIANQHDAAHGRVDQVLAGDAVELILSRTPAYAEAGGQVGDTGAVTGPDGRGELLDTYYRGPRLVVHRVQVSAGTFREGQDVLVAVDSKRRQKLRQHHTGTHLLHAALRRVLGTHVKQAGSLVAPDHLRFDFSHTEALQDRDIESVEEIVNEQIQANLAVTTVELDFDEAMKLGAMALFGEKYGKRVRVVRIGDVSTELCGGTHVERSGDLGLLKISAETAVGAGVRRVEAVVGGAALAAIDRGERALDQIADILKTSLDEAPNRLRKLLAEQRALEKELDRFKERAGVSQGEGLLASARQVNGVTVVGGRADGSSPETLRTLADGLRDKIKSGILCIGSVAEGRVSLVVIVTKDLLDRFHAGRLIGQVAKVVGGHGGGRPDFAQAGGRDPQQLDQALTVFYDLVAQNSQTPVQ